MRKVLVYVTGLLLGILLFGCKNMPVDELNIYALNDFHGAVLENGEEPGLSRLGKFLMDEKKAHPKETVILSAGDMFQGTAISSMTRGDVVIEAMNTIGFDAMTVGNHEFDWGISGISRLNDLALENGEAQFPILGANVIRKSTGEIAEWAKPYTVISRGDLKIGIIGTIGETLTEDILATIVEDYEFTDQLETIRKYTKILRTEKGCDIVIVVSHDDTSRINPTLADETGDYAVDAVINGHTHSREYGIEVGDKGVPLPYSQSKDLGKFIGKITLKIDPDTKKVTDAWSDSLVSAEVAKKESAEINSILHKYQDYIDQANEVLAVSSQYVSRTDGAKWAANTLNSSTGSDVAFVNIGGIRSAAFPIYQDSEVRYSDIFRMMPFENTVITFTMTGREIRDLVAANSDLYYSSSYNPSSGTIGEIAIDPDQKYACATTDFVFLGRSDFRTAENVSFTDELFRDQLVAAVKGSHNGRWTLQ